MSLLNECGNAQARLAVRESPNGTKTRHTPPLWPTRRHDATRLLRYWRSYARNSWGSRWLADRSSGCDEVTRGVEEPICLSLLPPATAEQERAKCDHRKGVVSGFWHNVHGCYFGVRTGQCVHGIALRAKRIQSPYARLSL